MPTYVTDILNTSHIRDRYLRKLIENVIEFGKASCGANQEIPKRDRQLFRILVIDVTDIIQNYSNMSEISYKSGDICDAHIVKVVIDVAYYVLY